MPEAARATSPISRGVSEQTGRPTAHLYLDGVDVTFDGFKALNGLSLIVDKGELRTIIGPNGAGKTTMLDVITGKTKPDEGTVFFNNEVDLTKLDESTIANLGIGRKFQKPTVFETLTVWQNLELALKANRGILRTLFASLTPTQRERIEEALSIIGLRSRRDMIAGSLSHGQKQWLEIGMLWVQDQALLLLDEPVAGMTDGEREQTAEIIRGMIGHRTVIVVEHDMHFVRSLNARVTVLHEGRVLTEGSLDSVQRNPTVVEVYLGR
jgi:urea transport system ATP-binding protein